MSATRTDLTHLSIYAAELGPMMTDQFLLGVAHLHICI